MYSVLSFACSFSVSRYVSFSLSPAALHQCPPHQCSLFLPSLPSHPVLSTTAQDCALTFYFSGSQSNRVVFTGLTAEEKAASGNNTSGHRLTCACTSIEALTPLQWLDVNGMVLPKDRKVSLVDYKTAGNQPGSAVHLRINKADFSCAEAGKYTCVTNGSNHWILRQLTRSTKADPWPGDRSPICGNQ